MKNDHNHKIHATPEEIAANEAKYLEAIARLTERNPQFPAQLESFKAALRKRNRGKVARRDA